jgi:hypothetical protein
VSTLIRCGVRAISCGTTSCMNSGCANASPPEHLISHSPGSAANVSIAVSSCARCGRPRRYCLLWMQYEQS